MKQTFIPIGTGYGDLFEMEQLMKYNAPRVSSLLLLHTTLEKEPVTSIVLVMNPTIDGKFQAMYSIFESIPYPYPNSSKRIDLIRSWAGRYNIKVQEFDVKASHHFYEPDLYYQYLIGVLRLQRVIRPME